MAPSPRLPGALACLLLLAALPRGGRCTCSLPCGNGTVVSSLVQFTLSGASPSGFFDSALDCAWACAALRNATSPALFYSLTVSTGKCTCFDSCESSATYVTPSYRGLVAECGPRALPPIAVPPPPSPNPPPSPPAPLPYCRSPAAPLVRVFLNSHVGARYDFLVCNNGPLALRNLQLSCPPALTHLVGISENCKLTSVVLRGTRLDSCTSFSVQSTTGMPSFSVVGDPFSSSSTVSFRPNQSSTLAVRCRSYLLTLPTPESARSFPVYSYRCVIANTGSPAKNVRFTCKNFSPVTCSGITVDCALPSGAVVPTGKDTYSFQFETGPGAITFSGVSFLS